MHLDDIHNVDPDLAYWLQVRMQDEFARKAADVPSEILANMRDLDIVQCPNCMVRPVGKPQRGARRERPCRR
jgi:hypothetical protein